MHEFENSLIRGIYISTYIASWLNTGVGIDSSSLRYSNKHGLFIAWLKSLTIDGSHLTDDEVWRIYYFAMNGKLELKESAKEFLSQKGL